MEEMELDGDVLELANILDVPVATAGIFPYSNQPDGAPPITITEEELDTIIEGSTVLQPVIQEAIHTGIYRGNEHLQLKKPIPGLLNVGHQDFFPDTIKDRVKDVSVEFFKQDIPDEQGNLKPWIVQRFNNVPEDIVTTLQAQFPWRSVEFLSLTDPDTGKTYPKTIRSTAFLHKFTRPAIPGQSPDLVVEFAGPETPVTTIITNQSLNKETTMADKQEKKADVAELQAMEATLAKQQEMITELQANFQNAEKEREAAIELARKQEAEKDAKIVELQAQQTVLQGERFVAELSRLRKQDGKTYRISPAFLEIVKPILEKNGVIEMAEGQTPQDAMFHLFDEIADMGPAIVVQLSLDGEKAYSPDESKPSKEAMIQELMAKEGITENEAWVRVTESLQEYKVEV